MKLIREIRIENFRSFRRLSSVGEVGDYTTLVGLNNSGKSNVLRALNLFFYNEVEPGTKLDFNRDFHFVAGKKKKVITITVKFDLPANFSLKRIKRAEEVLGRKFDLSKSWDLQSLERPTLKLRRDDEDMPTLLNDKDRDTAEQFLSLIHYRYIPSHVHPYSMVREESEGLKDSFLRRLTHKGRSKSEEVQKTFSDIAQIAENAVNPLSELISKTNPEIEGLRLSTPQSLRDLLFSFSLEIQLKKGTLKSDLLGSGLQSQLMYLLLYMIDSSYRQRFGWRQATIWAIEEPESSMHSSLEATMSFFFRDITTKPNNRIQIVCTTHSDMFIQYSTSGIFFSLDTDTGRTSTKEYKPNELVRVSSRLGISRYSHPLLYYPLDTIVLVEGLSDKIIFEKARNALGISNEHRIETLESLTAEAGKGGINSIITYLESNKVLLDNRMRQYPVLVLADWSCKEHEIKRLTDLRTGKNGLEVVRMKEEWSNQKLSKDFDGIERFLSIELINEGQTVGLFKLLKPTDDDFPLSIADHKEFGESKVKFAHLVYEKGVSTDFEFFKKVFDEIDSSLKNAQQKLQV